MTRKKQEDLILPNREATMRDMARFSHWAGVDFHIALTPIRKTPRKRKVDRKTPRT